MIVYSKVYQIFSVKAWTFSVRNITNIQSKLIKIALPIFFINLEPDPNNANIFNLSSLRYTKIKIEESHSRRDLPQCHRCQNYGHTKTYCNREPRCIRYGASRLSELCEKPKDTLACCALCREPHHANYKGYTKHKLHQRSRNSKFKDFNCPLLQTQSKVTQKNISLITTHLLKRPSPNTYHHLSKSFSHS